MCVDAIGGAEEAGEAKVPQLENAGVREEEVVGLEVLQRVWNDRSPYYLSSYQLKRTLVFNFFTAKDCWCGE